ncbi:AT-rich interactive domain-containing protein 5B isoform X1 [Varanus komodoensis]|uniref:AT-rich interactive domain-containing protein 5B isoform X1 n=1 Tax=Varanus komodoensis TaxID=61221 RepID=UPI001CF7D0CB|nr:AT-rich interactive domain-containing protein 5B isoform X1 [Varanus komodoensis]XP_044276335.1 AT-rich interactive domain-containing protein 5B isoform X1 [Varanus komodoensis]
MEPNSVQWVGSPCGLHGPYIFYKAFQFHLDGKPRILSLGDFFFVRCKAEDPICIAELQLLWEERTSRQLLSSSKLYFLPEDTPQGRNSDHGEDEVIAASEKVTVKLEDLAKWAQTDFSKWKHGLRGEAIRLTELGKNGQKEALSRFRQSTHNSGLNFKDILKEKADLGEADEDSNVLILSYPQYCRYRSMLKRIQGKPSSVQADQFVLALGGIAVISKNPQILYCRDTFDHPTLIENESICDEFAPNLKGRPRKKKPCPQRRDSLNSIKDSNNNCESKAVAKVKCEAKLPLPKTKNNTCKKGSSENKSKVSVGDECRADEQAFLVALYKYMKERKTPIERIPYLGFKQINLWTMFQAAQKLGGYETITARRQWKHIYDELGGNPGSTSAATCTRRHYERLILPYERFIKGEEDKPLPPVKPRKQDNVAQEGESKIKLSGTKRIKNENQKIKKEKDNTQKSQDAPEVSSEQEQAQECTTDQKSLTELTVEEEMKLSVEGPQVSLLDTTGTTSLEKMDFKEACSNVEEVKEEEMPSIVSFSSALVPPEENAVLDSAVGRLPSPSEDQDEPKQEERAPCFTDSLESEAHEVPFNSFSTIQLPLPSPSKMGDDKLPEMADYIANCTVKVDQLGNEDIHNALKQSPKVLVVQNFDMFKEQEPPSSLNGDPSFGYTPLLYSKGNPGIMSPLAKKKLLSQVSGATLSCSYPYGSPPPLISKKKLSGKDDLLSNMPQASHAPLMDTVAVSRPSVIQHVQSFKPKSSEERKPTLETYRHESLLKKADSGCCDFSKQHLSTLAESYALKSEIQDMKERMSEKRALHHSHMPSFLADFYSSPHLHSLYRQTEHHLNNEQVSKYLPRDMYRDTENISMFPQHKHHDKRNLAYHPPLHQQEKKSPMEASSDDQPTDLSLPKSTHKQTAKVLGSSLLHASVGQPESKTLSQFQTLTGTPLSLDCHPKACRVSPMTVAAPKKHGESLVRSSKQQSLRKMEGMVHPILSHKNNAQTVGAARPLKRSLEDLDKTMSEKKIRAVSPLRLPKEAPAKDKSLEQEAEGSKPVPGLPPGGMLEGHKFPLSSPIFTGLYPGTLCNRIPTGYSHPLQYLKNQTVLSPLMQPLALHSFVVQRQFLTSPGNSQQLYRHLAAATPVGSSYGDLLHNNIYPLAALNPQAAFPPSQLSSVHPSTKL